MWFCARKGLRKGVRAAACSFGVGDHRGMARSIKILPYDRVLVELSPYDLTRGRIVFRYRS